MKKPGVHLCVRCVRVCVRVEREGYDIAEKGRATADQGCEVWA